jgi:prepilin peptidase CpaA
MNLHSAALAALACTSCYAIWSDVRWRRLSNLLCLIVAALGVLFAFASGGATLAGSGLLHGLAALIVGILLFAAGAIGGGDAKYYAAVALWFPLRLAGALLLNVSLSGLVLFLVWFASRRLLGIRISKADASEAGKFPYGVPIAVGSVALLAWLGG